MYYLLLIWATNPSCPNTFGLKACKNADGKSWIPSNDNQSTLRQYLRVPSKWFAMLSRKVFCGARRPFITGILSLISQKRLLVCKSSSPQKQPGGEFSGGSFVWSQLSWDIENESVQEKSDAFRSISVSSWRQKFPASAVRSWLLQQQSLNCSSVSGTPLTMVPAISLSLPLFLYKSHPPSTLKIHQTSLSHTQPKSSYFLFPREVLRNYFFFSFISS